MIRRRVWREARGVLRATRDAAAVIAGRPERAAARPLPTLADRAVVQASLRHVAGWVPPDLGEEDVILLSVVKDAAELVEAFLDHHLGLGVRGVVLLDNGSEDETVELARRYQPVLVLQSRLPFRTYVHAFRAVLRDRFGRGCWSLMLDADEQLEHPFRETLSLGRVARHLNLYRYNLVVANMLEVFAKGPLSELPAVRGNALEDLYAYYDLSDLQRAAPPAHLRAPPGVELHAHGIRKRAFGREQGYLHKLPLAFFRDGLEPWHLTGHHVHSDQAKVADFSCVIHHFKFTGQLEARCREELRTRSHAGESEKAADYLRVLETRPDLDLHAAAARPEPRRGTGALLETGHLYASGAYRDLADREGRHRKVFCIGFHKTGTTSMGVLLRDLGYTVVSAYRTRDRRFVDDLAAGRLGDLFRMADRANAFEDNPWPLFFRELDARYPNSKFIFTDRDPDRWLESVVGHFGHQDEPGSPMRALIYGEGRGDPRGHEAAYRARFLAHKEAVLDHFAGRDDDLLVVDVGAADALDRVCRFLGHGTRLRSMPHANRRRG